MCQICEKGTQNLGGCPKESNALALAHRLITDTKSVSAELIRREKGKLPMSETIARGDGYEIRLYRNGRFAIRLFTEERTDPETDETRLFYTSHEATDAYDLARWVLMHGRPDHRAATMEAIVEAAAFNTVARDRQERLRTKAREANRIARATLTGTDLEAVLTELREMQQ